MPLEIERKFLVNRQIWDVMPKPAGIFYRQGYLVGETGKTVRLRIAGEKAFLTIKGPTHNAIRSEYEYQIPVKDAEEMFDLFKPTELQKTRYRIHFNQKVWEVDEFSGDNEGLVIAEVELLQRDEQVSMPSWIDLEVTEDPRYYNSYLAANPYRTWV